MSMLEYCKMILEKVSFDHKLFKKELKKSLRMLMGTEREEFVNWVASRFGNATLTLAYN